MEIIAGIIVIVLVIAVALRNRGPLVAEGWEDENGFHYGKRP